MGMILLKSGCPELPSWSSISNKLSSLNPYAKANPGILKSHDEVSLSKSGAVAKKEQTPETPQQKSKPEIETSKDLSEQSQDVATLKQSAKTPREIYEARLKEVADKPKRTIRRFESGTRPQEFNILRPDAASVRLEAQKTQKAAFKRLNVETPKSDDRKVSLKPLELSEKHGMREHVDNRVMKEQYSKILGAWVD